MKRAHLIMLLAVTLVACPDDAEPSAELPDVGETETSSGDADTMVETEPDTAGDADTSVEPDAASDADTSVDAGPFVWPWPLESIDVPAHASWKARIVFPEDPFLAEATSYDPPSPRWVKFTVLTGDPTRVFFQDSRALPFHYDFGTAQLPSVRGLAREAYDQVTLFNAQRKAILGAVLFAPFRYGGGAIADEIGIQLAGRDALDPRVVTTVLELVKAAIDPAAPSVALAAFYMPTWEQAEVARLSADYFAHSGFPLGSADRWSPGDLCYVRGWAVGRLVEVAPDAIAAAWQAGELTPGDILVTDQVPAEVPPVAGIITRVPSTPASHVAILAGTFEIPFVFVATAASRAVVAAHLGELVALRASDVFDVGSSGHCRLELASGDAIPAADRAALADLKRPPELDFPARVSPGALSVSAATLTRADIASYGGEAADFAILRSAIPEASPDPAIAFSFDLFDRLLARPAPDMPGTTLGAAIGARLGVHAWPPDMGLLATDLAAVRDLIERASFAPEDVSAILAALAPFDAERTLRFRPSTNVEDGATFTGAGLYDSYSGCVGDDIDADGAGPSACDPSEPGERGVLRAMLEVYASFWSDNAFLARLVPRVPAAQVAMGLLVHHSPDDVELANGVAVVIDRGFSRNHTLTTQLGAVSVTSPEGSAQPEVVSADVYDFGTYFTLVQGSALVPLGDHVMAWEADYLALTALLERIALAWAATVPSGTEFALDLEYKELAHPGAAPTLEIEQVRPLPLPDRRRELTSYLLPGAEPLRRCTFQGESGSLFGNHRGKLIVQLEHRPTFLDAANRERGFYTDVDLLLTGDVRLQGAPATLPGAFFAAPVRGEYDWSPRVDGFVLGAGESAKEYAINTYIDWLVTAPNVPLRVIGDGRFTIEIEYTTAQYDPDYWDGTQVSNDYVQLGECPDDVIVTPAHPAVQREAAQGDVAVDIRFWYPPVPTGATAGYTAWLTKWDRTLITGLTSTPLELRGYWSQTFRPGHHNFDENFLFEPALEEGISETLLAELAALDIRLIHVRVGYEGGEIKVVGASGVLRELMSR